MNPLDAGYSGTPLIKKLGFEAGDSVHIENTPAWYSEFAKKYGLELTPGLPATHAHLFFDDKNYLINWLDNSNLQTIEKSLWISWPKKASGVQSNLTEQDLRDLVLPLDWVDTKVAAIDDTWSGLKFLRRKV